jgi:hypothetical protein
VRGSEWSGTKSSVPPGRRVELAGPSPRGSVSRLRSRPDDTAGGLVDPRPAGLIRPLEHYQRQSPTSGNPYNQWVCPGGPRAPGADRGSPRTVPDGCWAVAVFTRQLGGVLIQYRSVLEMSTGLSCCSVISWIRCYRAVRCLPSSGRRCGRISLSSWVTGCVGDGSIPCARSTIRSLPAAPHGRTGMVERSTSIAVPGVLAWCAARPSSLRGTRAATSTGAPAASGVRRLSAEVEPLPDGDGRCGGRRRRAGPATSRAGWRSRSPTTSPMTGCSGLAGTALASALPSTDEDRPGYLCRGGSH